MARLGQLALSAVTALMVAYPAGGIVRVNPGQGTSPGFPAPADCQTPSALPGNCVRIRSCEPLFSLVHSRPSPQQVDFLRRSQCGFDGNSPRVCCPQRGMAPSPGFPGRGVDWNKAPGFTPAPPPGFTPEPAPGFTPGFTPRPAPGFTPEPAPGFTPGFTPRPAPGFTPGFTPGIPQEVSSTTTTTTTTTPAPASPPTVWKGECGRQIATAGFGRVVGGLPARLGEWPWIAALGYRYKRYGSNTITPMFKCGGTLISDRHVITAGHCVHKKTSLYLVRLGELDLEDDEDGANPVDIMISERHVHPQYSPVNFTNDIAILTLRDGAPMSAGIQPACLPTPPELRMRSFVRENPFTAGWGSTYFNGPSSSLLQQVQLPVVSVEECRQAFQKIKTAVIDNRTICAGLTRGGKDACQGDSGGPLVWPMQGTFYLIGVVSYGLRCAEAGYPGVYTRVSEFMDWIAATAR